MHYLHIVSRLKALAMSRIIVKYTSRMAAICVLLILGGCLTETRSIDYEGRRAIVAAKSVGNESLVPDQDTIREAREACSLIEKGLVPELERARRAGNDWVEYVFNCGSR